MIRSLYGKLAIALMVLLGLVGVTHILLTLFTTTRHIQEVNQRLNHTLAQHLVHEKILMRGGEVDQDALDDVFHMLMVINPTIELYLLDPRGRVLAYSAPPGTVERKSVSLEPIRTFLAGTRKYPILGDDPRDLGRQKIFSVYPIPLNPSSRLRKTAGAPTAAVEPSRYRAAPHQGYLYIVLASEEYDSVAEILQGSYILRLGLGIAAGSLVCAVIGGLYAFNVLTRRLRRLARSVDRFTAAPSVESFGPSELDGDAKGDEIDQLAVSFGQMAARITEQMRALENKDELRRVLVANISHDLRTPLATLHAYLETLLLKDGQLRPQEQKRYLEIATKHSDRLGKLVSALFELSKLDSRETELQIESFSLAELVQDVVQELQLIAREKRVELGAELGENLPFVRADISLIERVLENLIENAIRHTPPRGSVIVSLAAEKDCTRVRVRDTGCGISESELPHIFDRFYRGHQGGSDEGSQGAGLGLAITKRILDLHGSAIEVASRLDEGTEFTFCLPATSSEAV